MKKADIAEAAYRTHGGIPRRTAVQIVDSLLQAMARALGQGERVVISGFGTFRVKARLPRRGRNPQTGEGIPIPGGRRVVFHPSERLVDAINQGGAGRTVDG
ncbi:MAG: HU family DNA-binding protein [Acidobacteria bacterium]|nr:HU family DNA-binding protein [Acidobacteriota bacterium]